MCGIMGVISKNEIDTLKIKNAEDIQSHRGPNAKRISAYHTEQWNIALGHQRLSILDLTESGTQPMGYGNGEGIIIYNGEVYNYLEIKEELIQEGRSFYTSTDTEVILVAMHHWGIEKALNKFNGMWAFAWLDMKKKKITLCRDRMGVKPLHFTLRNNQLFFASEAKTILALTGEKFALNKQVVGEFLFQSLLETSQYTFFEGIEKLPAGHYCEIDLTRPDIIMNLKSYWKIPSSTVEYHDVTKLQEEINELFQDAVKLRMRSDVPVGVLLSGGVDSSAIASSMQNHLGKKANLNLLSAVSDNPKYDESPFIDIMGRYLELPVHKVNLNFSPKEAISLLSQVCWFNDEPVGSFANVAHYLLMKQAKDLGVTVILSGQGADELLCGYRKYLGFYIQSLLRRRKYYKVVRTAFSFIRNGTVIKQYSFADAKRYLPSFMKKRQIDIRGAELKEYKKVNVGLSKASSIQERQIVDLEKFSVPVLNHFEDRMSMAWSREVRVPFLDYRLVEKLISIPTDLKLSKGWTKYIFRKALESNLPKEIVWRKDKQGFVNPQSSWLKHELKEEVMGIFQDEKSYIYKYGIVDRTKLIEMYNIFCNQSEGKGKYSYKDIFNPLALEIWLRKYQRYIS